MKIELEIPDNWLQKPLSRDRNYAMLAWKDMMTSQKFWRKSFAPFTERAVPHGTYYSYNLSNKSAGIKSGLTSVLNPLPDTMTHDHFWPPQTIGEFLMDRPDPYLYDFEMFFKVYMACSYTHKITKTQNTELSDDKHNIPRIYSYRDLETESNPNGILLYDIETGEQVDNLIAPMIEISDNFMSDFCSWERKFILDEDSEYGEPLPENIEIAKKINLQRRKSFLPKATLDKFYNEEI